MFVAGQQIFTNSGWKNVEDISGTDKVLNRNFISNAEFIQPFALHKSQYDGEVIELGGRNWSATTTPDHNIAYEKFNGKFVKTPAVDFEAKKSNKIHRSFRYMFSDDPHKEFVKITDEFGSRNSTIQHEDWYVLVAYMLTKGYIKTGYGRPMVHFYLDEYDVERQLALLGDILDRIGIPFHLQYTEKTRAKLVVSSKNTLAYRFKTRLGSFKRREMSLPDKMIYQSNKALANLFIETFMDASTSYNNNRDKYTYKTTNKALLDSISLFGTLHGYGVGYVLQSPKGSMIGENVTKSDSYVLFIHNPVKTHTATYKKTKPYQGAVYSLDLFEGQVYIREKGMPVWIDPK